MNCKLLLFGSVLWLAGCSLVPKAGESSYFPLLPPSSYGGEAAWQQTMHLSYGAEDTSLLCFVSVTPALISIRGFSAAGQRLFSIEYDGQVFRVDASEFSPQRIPARRILGDLQQAYWPLAILQKALVGSTWTVSEPRTGVRTIRHGEALYAQTYASSDGQRLWLINLALDYSLDISSQAVEVE